MQEGCNDIHPYLQPAFTVQRTPCYLSLSTHGEVNQLVLKMTNNRKAPRAEYPNLYLLRLTGPTDYPKLSLPKTNEIVALALLLPWMTIKDG